MAVFAALALGLNIVIGMAGLLDLGYVAFYAVGAYAWAIFGSKQMRAKIQQNSNILYPTVQQYSQQHRVGDWRCVICMNINFAFRN